MRVIVWTIGICVLCFSAAFTALICTESLALAQDAGPTVETIVKDATPENPVDTLSEIVANIKSGNWRLAAAAILSLLMLGLSKAREHLRWFRGDRGGAVLVGLLGVMGAFASSLATSAPLNWDLVLATLGVVWTAVGGYGWIKRLIWPKDA